MRYTLKMVQVGHSRLLRIPRDMREFFNMENGDMIEIEIIKVHKKPRGNVSKKKKGKK